MATEPIDMEIAGQCVNEIGSAIGMPQLCGEWFGNQIFWLVVALVAIYFILSRVALPRIGSVLAERQGTITNDIAAAEDLKAKATEAEAQYDKALIDARANAHQIIKDAKTDIQADLDLAIAKADEEIAAKAAESEKAIAEIRESSLQNVEEVAKETARAIVAAFGGSADEKTVSAAVDARMKG